MMTRSKYFLLLSFVFIFLSYACTDMLEEDKTPPTIDPEPITPDLTAKIFTSVSGFATNEAGEPVSYAAVIVGDKQSTTDEYGYFKLSDVSVPEFAGQVKITKLGYFESYKTFCPQENKEAFVRLQVWPRTTTGDVEAATGGATSTEDGAQVTLPANGVVMASTTPYTGVIHVNSRLIHPSTDNVLYENPGDARGINADGHAQALEIFSTVAVELTGSDGQALQLGEGKTATIRLPIPTNLLADAPQTIDLWSFDTTTGLWKQEGSATKTGNNYEGTVPHFSFWAGAIGVPLVNFSARIVNTEGEPLAHVPVSVTIAGMPRNAGHGRFGYTDANGYVNGTVFANKDLVLDILTPCALSAYEHEFSTTSADIDLGTLTGNLGQNVVTLSGTAQNCEGEPVANGYVQTYDNGFYNRIAIVNGTFSFTGLVCTNTEVNLVAVDYITYQQNEPQSVIIHPGVNALGTLTTCGTSTLGQIAYTIDGTTVTIQEPADTIAAYLATPQSIWTQVVTLSGDPNTNQQMAFQFNGGTQTGTDHTVSEVFSNAFPSGRGYWPVPITVTIAEYGEKGGFIRGSFSGNLLDFEDNSLHSFSCSFKVRRQN
ncbi:MAG TPA: hypothetical protein VK658_07065 [Chryseolinea sp.]|nr:hypothetical protein [Chryseolinea sp.]